VTQTSSVRQIKSGANRIEMFTLARAAKGDAGTALKRLSDNRSQPGPRVDQ
jgi:hypothetical protein